MFPTLYNLYGVNKASQYQETNFHRLQPARRKIISKYMICISDLANMLGSRGVTGGSRPLKKHKNTGFPSKTGPDLP